MVVGIINSSKYCDYKNWSGTAQLVVEKIPQTGSGFFHAVKNKRLFYDQILHFTFWDDGNTISPQSLGPTPAIYYIKMRRRRQPLQF